MCVFISFLPLVTQDTNKANAQVYVDDEWSLLKISSYKKVVL